MGIHICQFHPNIYDTLVTYLYETCIFVKLDSELFKTYNNICNFNTRYPNRLAVPAKRTKLYGKNAYWMAINIFFNRLHDDMKPFPISLFKVQFKKWLI